MADVKESALSAKSDFAYVRALDSSGNSIRISKSDLTSVIGNVIGINKFLKMDSGILISDFNDYTTPLTIAFNSSSSTFSNGPSFGNGVLDVRGGLNYGWVLQTAYKMPYDGTKVCRSYSSGAGWTEWM